MIKTAAIVTSKFGTVLLRLEGNKKCVWNSERNFRLAIFVSPGVKAYRLLVNHSNKGETSAEL